MLSAIPNSQIWASDFSSKAIQVAQKNRDRILGPEQAHRLHFLQVTDPLQVLEPFKVIQKDLEPNRFDFLLSNPPYLAESDEVEEDVKIYEPSLALFGPQQDVLHFYRRIALEGPQVLRSGGRVYCEVPHERAQEILALFRKEVWLDAQLLTDLTGRPRVLIASLQ